MSHSSSPAKGARPVASSHGQIGLAGLMVGAIGVVFGDIGTSPLYALQTVFSLHHHAVAPTEADVLGVISMVVWCLLIIVTFAYIGLIMRADNQGEGGILARTALVLRKLHGPGGVGPGLIRRPSAAGGRARPPAPAPG